MGMLEALDRLQKNKKLSIDEDTLVKENDQIELVSSGSIILDKLLSKENKIGGIGKARITEIVGLESSGKCLTSDTYIKTAKGLETIAEIFIRNDIVPSCSSKKVEKSEELYNEKGVLEKTTHFTCNNRTSVYKVTTRSGNTIEGTAKHPLRVIDENGYIVWKYMIDIKSGDYLVCQRFENFIEKENYILDSNKIEEARFLGYLVADGCFSDRNRITFSNSEVDVIYNYKKAFSSVMALSKEVIKDYPRKDSNSIEHHYNDYIKCPEFYNKFEIKEGLAKDKVIPYSVRTECLEYKRIFIQSYMDLESHYDEERYEIEVSSASRELLLQLKLMLQLDFGIISFLGEKETKLDTWEESKIYFRLCIYGWDLDKYLKIIGFSVLSKEAIIKNCLHTNHDSIPNMGRLLFSLYKSLSRPTSYTCSQFYDYIGDKPRANLNYCKWLEMKKAIGNDGHKLIRDLIDSYFKDNYYFDCVYVSELSGEKPTFDFAMSESASFIANGICSHNTTVSLHIAKEIQRLGGNVIFVDYEAALDREYAKNAIGVDINPARFVHLRPQCLEEGCDIIDVLLDDYKESKVDCIIIDSVKAMIPKVVLDGMMGDEPPMMIQARKIGTWLSKLVKRIKDTGTAVILLNQMIKNIKTNPYQGGGEYETTGGLAIRFYASTRIELKIVTKETSEMLNSITNKLEEMPSCVKVRANIIKNKIGTPYRKAEYYIKYGKGIDNKRSIIEMAVSHNIISQGGGGWYTYNEGGSGAFKIHGEDNMLKHLYAPENASILNDIADKIVFNQDPEIKEQALKMEEEEKKIERKIAKKAKKD